MIENGKSERIRRSFKGYIRVAALVFVLSGLAMLLATSGNDLLLVQTEPLFGLTNRTFLLIGGLLHLAFGGFLCAPIDLVQRGLLALWVGSCHSIYFVGMTWIKASAPFPAVQLVGWKIGANNPRIVSVFWKLFILYLLVGSLVYLILEWRRMRRSAVEMLLSKWKRVREPAVTPATPGQSKTMLARQSPADAISVSQLASKEDLSQKPRSTELKFSCHYCGQHIQCSEGYSGKQVNCPACGKPIQVPGEPEAKARRD